MYYSMYTVRTSNFTFEKKYKHFVRKFAELLNREKMVE